LYNILSESERARACQECHTCEELCPQQISISEMMARVRDFFT
jgi:predicted aldo/keto reductase-like oxidoreductase